VFTFFFQVGEEEEERKNKRERFSGVLYLGGFYYLVKEGFVYLGFVYVHYDLFFGINYCVSRFFQ
jgi:hypothetical protein